MAVDLPGYAEEDVQMELNDGCLTIQAVRGHSNDEGQQQPATSMHRDLLRRGFYERCREEGDISRKVRG